MYVCRLGTGIDGVDAMRAELFTMWFIDIFSEKPRLQGIYSHVSHTLGHTYTFKWKLTCVFMLCRRSNTKR